LARLHLDHNVSLRLALLLGMAGHDVVVTRDLGRSRSTDDTLLLSSVQAGRIFVTHNRRDFRLPHDAWLTWPAAFGMALPTHPGILVLDTAPPDILARVLLAFLRATSPARLANAIFWWHRHDGWRRPAIDDRWEPYEPGDAEE
jgi:hypothetical protein